MSGSGSVKYDSISQCSQGNDLYAMIRNPSAKMPTKAAPTKQVDSIKSLRTQMERDAVAQLGKAMKNFIFVARAGKFVFLAIMIPPYILLYGMPKWMISELLPMIFRHSFKPFNAFNDLIKKLFKTNENDKGLISNVRNAFAALSTQAAEYTKWIHKASKALFAHMKHHVVAFGYRILQPYMPMLQKSVEAAEAVTKMLLQKTYEKGDKHIEIARRFASFAWKTAKQEFSNQFRPYVESIKKQFSTLRKQVKKLIEKPRLEIQKFKTAITHSLKRTNEVLKSTGLKISKNTSMAIVAAASYVARPVIEWASPKIQWAASAAQAGREKMVRNFEQIRSFVQNLASAALEAVQKSHHAVIEIVKNVLEIAIPAFVKDFFDPQGGFKKKSQQMIQNLRQKFKKLKNIAAEYAFNGLQAVKSRFFRYMRKVRELLIYAGQQIKQLPKRIFTLVVKSYRMAIYSSIKVGHFLRWVSVWSRVLARLAWQELRERTAFIANASSENPS